MNSRREMDQARGYQPNEHGTRQRILRSEVPFM